eukprot:1206363-Prymnesium_polylepis.3
MLGCTWRSGLDATLLAGLMMREREEGRFGSPLSAMSITAAVSSEQRLSHPPASSVSPPALLSHDSSEAVRTVASPILQELGVLGEPLLDRDVDVLTAVRQ